VAALGFCFLAAQVLKTRANWIKYHDETQGKIDTLAVEFEKTMRGDLTQADTESVAALREQYGRILLDRGRVWRRGAPIFQQDGSVMIATSPPPDPAAPAGTPLKRNRIDIKTVFHAFRESPPNAEGIVIPERYIGEFRAIAVTDQSVTVAPNMPLAPDQIAAGRQPGPAGPPTWSLYEVCPIDGHEWFAGVTAEEMQKLIPRPPTGLSPENYQKLIESYVRDGQEATDNDPPENVWYEVKFVAKYEVVVDAVSATTLDGEPFNFEGQAVFDRLRRAEPKAEPGKVVFGPDADQVNTAVLDKVTTEMLVAQGVAEKVKAIFRRKLTDYERKLHSTFQRIVELDSRRRQLDLDNKALLAAATAAETQSQALEQFRGQMSDDLEKTKQEGSELAKYVSVLDARVTELQTRLSQLYRSNKALSRQLAEQSARLTEEIERRPLTAPPQQSARN
jgi:hypothetical protein